MSHLTKYSKTQELTQRFIVFVIAAVIVISLCAFHGHSGRRRTVDLIDQMIESRNLTGKFWRIEALEDGQITLTKYQRVIILSCPIPQETHIGDKVSFIAKRPPVYSGKSVLWQPERIRFHGTSWSKFLLSVLPLLVILYLFRKHFHLDKNEIAIHVRERDNRCRMV